LRRTKAIRSFHEMILVTGRRVRANDESVRLLRRPMIMGLFSFYSPRRDHSAGRCLRWLSVRSAASSKRTGIFAADALPLRSGATGAEIGSRPGCRSALRGVGAEAGVENSKDGDLDLAPSTLDRFQDGERNGQRSGAVSGVHGQRFLASRDTAEMRAVTPAGSGAATSHVGFETVGAAAGPKTRMCTRESHA